MGDAIAGSGGSAETLVTIREHESDAFAKRVLLRGFHAADGSFNTADVDATGALLVTGISGGGGSTSTVFQGTIPWLVSTVSSITIPISGNISLAAGSTITANQGTSPWITSIVSSTTLSIFGSLSLAAGSTVTANQGTSPWITSVVSQVTTPITGVISFAAGSTVTANQGTSPWLVSVVSQVSASVTAFQGAAPWTVSVVSATTTNVNIMAGATVTANQGTSPWTVRQASGSTMTVLQGGAPWTVSVVSALTTTVRNWAIEDAGTTLTALNITYTAASETASATITTTGYRTFDFYFTIVSAGTPTDIVLRANARTGSVNYIAQNGFLGNWRFSDASVATSSNRAYIGLPLPACGAMQISALPSGVDAAGSNFVISNAQVFLRT